MAWTSRSPFPQDAEVDRMKLQQLSREEYLTHELGLGSPGKAPVGGHTAVPSDPYRGHSYSPSGLNGALGGRGPGSPQLSSVPFYMVQHKSKTILLGL